MWECQYCRTVPHRLPKTKCRHPHPSRHLRKRRRDWPDGPPQGGPAPPPPGTVNTAPKPRPAPDQPTRRRCRCKTPEDRNWLLPPRGQHTPPQAQGPPRDVPDMRPPPPGQDLPTPTTPNTTAKPGNNSIFPLEFDAVVKLLRAEASGGRHCARPYPFGSRKLGRVAPGYHFWNPPGLTRPATHS